MTPPPDDPVHAPVALTGDGLDHVNTLLPGPEIRDILIAQGKQFRNGDAHHFWNMPEVLGLTRAQRRALHPAIPRHFPSLCGFSPVPIEDDGSGGFRYLSVEQGVLFRIKVVTGKRDFVTALNTPGLHVIYAGHARYGRGPCFGAGGDSAGVEWEEGHGPHPNDDGILRMGFPFIGVDAAELLEHGYVANLVAASVTMPPADCDPSPGLRGHLGALRPRTLEEIAGELGRPVAELVPRVRDPDPTKRYWTYGRGPARTHLVHHAGWENTLSTPDDLGSLEPQCRVFCHFGCDTFRLNYPIVRQRKRWRHQGDERYAYWTTAVSTGVSDVYWLYHVLTYPRFNAFRPLDASLRYAVQRTNRFLDVDGLTYHII